MTRKVKFLAATKGKDVDRPLIWLRESINSRKNIQSDPYLLKWHKEVRQRVKEIFSTGLKRIIFGTTTTPFSSIINKLSDIYKVLVDEVLTISSTL